MGCTQLDHGDGTTKCGSKGLLRTSVMLTLDPLTVGPEGYPLLLQTGEANNGQPLVDRQHPHDLFAEISVSYAHSFDEHTDAFVYIGYPGEPAIGPTAFMHRISAMLNPNAPLGHHWQDATHITFGVLTGGFRYKIWKLESSLFTGREPDEERWGFDDPRFDSYALRLSSIISDHLVAQVSLAHIQSPEVLKPDENIRRTTASLQHILPIRKILLSNSLIWGFNGGDGHQEHSITWESTMAGNGRYNLYSRMEWVQKSAEELVLDEGTFGEILNVSAITMGATRTLWEGRITGLLGAQMTLTIPDSALEELYGKLPVSGQVYLQLLPARM